MGKTRQNPRYNVLSCRTSDAVLEKARRDRQRRFDDALSQ